MPRKGLIGSASDLIGPMAHIDEIEDRVITMVDPVCGKAIDLGDVAAHESYGGWAYFFCSTRCRDGFLTDPDRYTDAPACGVQHDGEHDG